ncbi:MAG TPA: hypothetical protein VMA95_13905 [Streptosporangiaceae bacterium]|nr:hypothetical protein [Streptosporangiaceae bacterium]
MSSAGGGQDGKPASSDAAEPGGASPAHQAAEHERAQATGEPQAPGSATAVVEKTRSGAETGQQPRSPKTQAPRRNGLRINPLFAAITMPFVAIGRFFRWLWRHNWFRHITLLLAYIAAGIGATWPRFTWLAAGKLPRTTDVAAFVWGFWWVAHQVVHLGNPFFTTYMAAPVGIQLGFSTLMPLAGYVMTPVTLLWGPSAAFTLLTLITPGLLCYAMYRAARLWLNQPGSIAAGAFFGLCAMMMWQNWYHVNIALGIVFLPVTIEAAVRLRRSQKIAPGVWLGLALGGAVMTSQEAAVIAVLLAAVLIIPWIFGKLLRDRASLRKALLPLGIGAVVALVFASPQLIAMAQQYASGGAAVPPGTLALNYTQFGVPLQTLFSPSPRIAYFGLHSLPSGYSFDAAPQGGTSVQPGEGLPGFGIVASVLAVVGLLIAWRKRYKYAWWFALLWLGCAILSLGTSIVIGSGCVVNQSVAGQLYGRSCRQFLPLEGHIHWVAIVRDGMKTWEQVRVSNLMPYTWLVRIPWLSGLREADRFALVGMIGVALLAGIVVQWLTQRLAAARKPKPEQMPAASDVPAGSRAKRRRRRTRWLALPALIVVAALSVFELGWQGGTTGPPFTPTESMLDRMSWFDAPVKADNSHSTVLDVPYGLRGGLSLVGSGISERALLVATNDEHPRAVSYTAWVPKPTINAVKAHPFFKYLLKYQSATSDPTPYQLRAAAADLKTLNIGWVIEWRNLWRLNHPEQRIAHLEGYLRDLGFVRVRETCLVPTTKPRPVCFNHPLENVWLLKYVPALSYKGPEALERRLHPCQWFWQHHPNQKCTVPKSKRG